MKSRRVKVANAPQSRQDRVPDRESIQDRFGLRGSPVRGSQSILEAPAKLDHCSREERTPRRCHKQDWVDIAAKNAVIRAFHRRLEISARGCVIRRASTRRYRPK